MYRRSRVSTRIITSVCLFIGISAFAHGAQVQTKSTSPNQMRKEGIIRNHDDSCDWNV